MKNFLIGFKVSGSLSSNQMKSISDGLNFVFEDNKDIKETFGGSRKKKDNIIGGVLMNSILEIEIKNTENKVQSFFYFVVELEEVAEITPELKDELSSEELEELEMEQDIYIGYLYGKYESTLEKWIELFSNKYPNFKNDVSIVFTFLSEIGSD